jgi:hypothetical protein
MQEVYAVQNWVYYIYNYNRQLLDFVKSQDSLISKQSEDISELKSIMEDLPKTKEDFKRLVDSYFAFDSVMERLRDIEKKIDIIEYKKQDSIPKVNDSSTNIRDRVLKKLAKSSKNYIKGMILNFVSKYGKVSALQLREIVVEEQGLCSKSSFYRILEELERENSLDVVSKGKIKVYVYSESSLPEQKTF